MAAEDFTTRTPHKVSRRRLITVTAAAAAVPLLPGRVLAQPRHAVWRGIALGAEAQIQLAHPDEDLARDVLKQCISEVRRLEGLFSLYQPGSALNRLNRGRALNHPALEFIELLSAAHQVSEETAGAFDVTVQPLWTLYAEHYAQPRADTSGPAEDEVRKTLELIDYAAVKVTSDRIALNRPGMALTLNGIAQGFVTDRIAALLRRNGFKNVLVHLGETYAGGTRADGTPWCAGIETPDGSGHLSSRVELKDRALATSAPGGHSFSSDGRHHHLFDPRSGLSTSRYLSVSVTGPSATMADALSTAFTVMPLPDIRAVLARRPDTRATIIGLNGRTVEI